MKVSLHLVARSFHQMMWGRALAEGFALHGVKVDEGKLNVASNADLAVVWTWRQLDLIEEMRSTGRRVLVMERGHLQPRRGWLSLGLDGLAGRGIYPPCADSGERFERNFGNMVKPWRSGGNYVLLIGQVPGDAALHGLHMEPWAQSVTDTLTERGHRVVWRPHPKVVAKGLSDFCPAGAEKSSRNLDDDLANARMVVVWSSTTAVEAVLAGVPTIAMDEGSIAWPVTGHDLVSGAPTPDRTEWLHALAWKQWNIGEVRSGLAWDHIAPLLQ